jgi:glycosyltransferase involved in cell wall biosynthesis
MRASVAARREPIAILHVAYSAFPADTRVKRELDALRDTGRRRAVIALRGTGERGVERRDGVTIVRVPGRKSRGGILSYLQEYAGFILRSRRLVARHRAFQNVAIVHVHTLPDFLLWAALPAKARGARLVFDMHEIFPEFAAAKFPPPVGTAFAWLAQRIERWARRRADLTVTVNRPINELLTARPIGKPERRIVVHNTPDPNDFGADPVRSPENGSTLETIYHGTLTRLYGLDVAIQAAGQAHRDGLPVRLTILGGGADDRALRQLTAESALGEIVRFEGPLPQSRLRERLARCDAGIVPTRLNGMTRYSLSTKLLEYVHLGIPVLAARLPSYQRYFDESVLWYWTPGDAIDLARALREFAAAPAGERIDRARRARAALASVSWPRERVTLLAAYAELLAAETRVASTAAIRSAAVPSP